MLTIQLFLFDKIKYRYKFNLIDNKTVFTMYLYGKCLMAFINNLFRINNEKIRNMRS